MDNGLASDEDTSLMTCARCVTTGKIPLNIDISYLPDAQRFASPYVPTDECKKIGTEKQIRDLIFCLLLHAPNLELL